MCVIRLTMIAEETARPQVGILLLVYCCALTSPAAEVELILSRGSRSIPLCLGSRTSEKVSVSPPIKGFQEIFLVNSLFSREQNNTVLRKVSHIAVTDVEWEIDRDDHISSSKVADSGARYSRWQRSSMHLLSRLVFIIVPVARSPCARRTARPNTIGIVIIAVDT